MAKFLFVLSRGLEDPTRATRCMQLANVAQREGHDVNIFLVDDGVIFAKKGMAENVVAPTGDDVASHLAALIQAKVPLMVCTPCAKARMLEESDFVETARMDTAMTMLNLAAEATVFTF